jgi:hypothetical protein
MASSWFARLTGPWPLCSLFGNDSHKSSTKGLKGEVLFETSADHRGLMLFVLNGEHRRLANKRSLRLREAGRSSRSHPRTTGTDRGRAAPQPSGRRHRQSSCRSSRGFD